jgi:hypothetical protein
MVPGTPLVVTLPFTEPSSAIVKLPLPEPDADTGGTSSAPVKRTLTALPPDIMPAQADSPSTARTIQSRFIHRLR